jgi:hypothetical protein
MAFYFNNTKTMDAESEELADEDDTIDIDVLLITMEEYMEALTTSESEH